MGTEPIRRPGDLPTRADAIHRQFARYVVVGLSSNATMYALYVLLTLTVLGPKIAMTVTYAMGVLIAFLANRNWTFRHQKVDDSPLVRFLSAYGLGYVINYCALFLFVDVLGLPHLYVQAAMIVFLAIMLFALQKYWVFRPGKA